MSVPKPSGPYSEEMTAGAAWPQVDESSFGERADALMDVLRQVLSVSESWAHQQSELFAPNTWSGAAAGAAAGAVTEVIGSLTDQQMSLATAVAWYRLASAVVTATKVAITEVVEAAQAAIAAVEAMAAIDPDAQSKIDTLVADAHSINTSAVADAASLVSLTSFRPPTSEINQILTQAGMPGGPPVPAAPAVPAPAGPAVPPTESSENPLLPASGGGPGGGDPQNLFSNGLTGSSTQDGAIGAQTGTPDTQSAAAQPGSTQLGGTQTAVGSQASTTDTRPAPSEPGSTQPAAAQNAIGTQASTTDTAPATPESNVGPAPAAPSAADPASPASTSPGSGLPSLGSTGAASSGGSASGAGSSSSSSSGLSGLGTGGSGSGAGSSAGGQSVSGAGSSPGSAGAGTAGGGGSQSGSGAGSSQSGAQAGPGGAGPAPAASPAAVPPVAPAAAAAGAAPPPASPVPAQAPAAGAAPGGGGVSGAGGGPNLGGVSVPTVGHGGVSPAAATGGPPASGPMGGGGMGGGGLGAGGGGAPVPLGPPPTPTPANPVAAPPAGLSGPPVTPMAGGSQASGGVAAAPIPVSAARAEREVILQAVNAEASRSRHGGIADPANLAVRIAAALNAEDHPDKFVYGFFWATAISTDGQILLANSYGLGYIPAGQNLPPQVRLASLEHSMPIADRVATATHPWLALQAWAQANDTTLRTIIGTEQQLDGVDLGVAKQLLRPDEIPSTSVMAGRDRLEMIAPEMAAVLAGTPDAKLADLLPPPLAGAEVPEDRRTDLWFAVVSPMMSGSPDRNMVHLNAFVDYARHCEDLAIHTGHSATEPEARRTAISDGMYWHHLAALIEEALGG